MATNAFQSNAFQTNAFQAAARTAFQPGAFQQNAFQIYGAPPVGKDAGGWQYYPGMDREKQDDFDDEISVILLAGYI